MKAFLRRQLLRASRHLPERLLLVFHETPVLKQMDYREPLRMNCTSELEYYLRADCCKKEPETVAWIERMPAGSVLYDIGANVGPYSLIAASRGLQVVAFEPHAVNYAQLVRNTVDNALNVMTLPLALSDVLPRLDKFAMSSLVAGSAEHQIGLSAGQWTPTCTLDFAVDVFHLPMPTHIKIDTDGEELPILRGAIRSIAQAQSILIEATPANQLGIEVTLKNYGYALKERHRIPSAPGLENQIWKR